jgi:hypothetical protein
MLGFQFQNAFALIYEEKEIWSEVQWKLEDQLDFMRVNLIEFHFSFQAPNVAIIKFKIFHEVLIVLKQLRYFAATRTRDIDGLVYNSITSTINP